MMAAVKHHYPPYQKTFHSFIINSAKHILIRVKDAGPVLPDAIQEQACHTLSYALKLPATWQVTRELLLSMAPKMEQAGHRDEWIPYLQRGIEQCSALNDIHTQSQLNLHLGLLHQVRGRLDEAGDCLQKSIAGFIAEGNSSGQVQALNRLAYVKRLGGDPVHAQELVETALEMLDEDDWQREFGYFVLGVVAFDKRNWLQAIEYFMQSLELCRRQGDQRKITLRTGNLGVALFSQGSLSEAGQCYEMAIQGFNKLRDPVQAALMQMNLGNVRSKQEKLESAFALYAAAESTLLAAHDELHLAMLYTNMGIVQGKLQKWQQAELSLQQAIVRWRQLGRERSYVNALDELGVIYIKQSKYDKAIARLQEALQKLKQIGNVSEYASIYQSVSTHLDEARNLVKQ